MTELNPNQYLELISPIKESSLFYKSQADKITIISDQIQYINSVKLKKEITTFINNSEKTRKEITKPILDFKKRIDDLASDSLTPAIESKEKITKLILDYETEQERLKQIERKRILELCKTFEIGMPRNTVVENEEMKGRIDTYFASLDKKDQENPDVKIAASDLIARINQKIILIEQEEANKREAEKLLEIAKSQEKENLELALKQAKIDQEKREQEAEDRRLKDEQIKQMLENERLEKEKSDNLKMATGMRTYTKFEILDPFLVPREYCEPSDKLINQAIKEGKTEISGIRIFTVKK